MTMSTAKNANVDWLPHGTFVIVRIGRRRVYVSVPWSFYINKIVLLNADFI